MYIIPGFLVSIATFPGVIVHELAHQLFCRITRVAVLDVCYFRLKNPAGYVTHEIPTEPIKQLLIGIGPFLINTTLGALIALPGAIPVIRFGDGHTIDYFFIWLGISIAMHSFPSIQDAKNIWNGIKKEETPMWLRILATPIVGLIYLCTIASVLWFDVIYGMFVAMLIPNIIIKLLA